MVMVDLGIPPGFDLLSEELQEYHENSADRKSGRLEKFSLTATQATLYFDSFAPGDTVTLQFGLRAKYPIRARMFQSRVSRRRDVAKTGHAAVDARALVPATREGLPLERWDLLRKSSETRSEEIKASRCHVASSKTGPRDDARFLGCANARLPAIPATICYEPNPRVFKPFCGKLTP
jgi:hypothetical protein